MSTEYAYAYAWMLYSVLFVIGISSSHHFSSSTPYPISIQAQATQCTTYDDVRHRPRLCPVARRPDSPTFFSFFFFFFFSHHLFLFLARPTRQGCTRKPTLTWTGAHRLDALMQEHETGVVELRRRRTEEDEESRGRIRSTPYRGTRRILRKIKADVMTLRGASGIGR